MGPRISLADHVLLSCVGSQSWLGVLIITVETSQRAGQLLEEGVTTGRPALAEPGTSMKYISAPR